MRPFTALFSATLLTAGTAVAPIATAQQPAEPPPQEAAPAQDLSDAQLAQFVSTAQEVATISQEYRAKLENAEDQSSQQQLQQEATAEMTAAVEDSGMTVNEFNSISQAVQQDSELQARVQTLVEESQ